MNTRGPIPDPFATFDMFSDLFLIPTSLKETVLNARAGRFPAFFRKASQKSPPIFRRDAVLKFFHDLYADFAPERLDWLNQTAFAKSVPHDALSSPRLPFSKKKGMKQ